MTPLPRRRVAVVVQRYGADVAGGAEWHAKSFVEAIAPQHEVTVLTSCARDAATWDTHWPPGESRVEGVRVLRFAHPPRNAGGRARVPLVHKVRRWLRLLFDLLARPRVAPPRGDDVRDGHLFLRRQGPCCAGLVDALRQGQGHFDMAVFFTALYHPSAEGLPVWGARSLLIPTLHDEKPMYLPWFHRVFAGAGEILFNAQAEQRLARRLYGADAARGAVVGAAVRVQPPTPETLQAARAHHVLPSRYLVYVGRIEKGKGCAELLACWQSMARETGDAVLVFVGKGALPIPPSARVRATGFVDAHERDALVAGAAALVVPSRHESLSLVALEAMALGVPLVVNAQCEVLLEHVRRSACGEAYRGRRQLRAALRRALARPQGERERLGAAGRDYVERHYEPAVVRRAWLAAIERVIERADKRTGLPCTDAPAVAPCAR